MIDVPHPIKKAMAVYGALDGVSSLVISCISTVNPRMIENTAEKRPRYKYSYFKNESAPSVIFPEMNTI
jgi:hypothetical protein